MRLYIPLSYETLVTLILFSVGDFRNIAMTIAVFIFPVVICLGVIFELWLPLVTAAGKDMNIIRKKASVARSSLCVSPKGVFS